MMFKCTFGLYIIAVVALTWYTKVVGYTQSVNTFQPQLRRLSTSQYTQGLVYSFHRYLFRLFASLDSTNDGDNTAKIPLIGTSNGKFDSDFAESISKPLPEWYKEQQKQQAIIQKEVEDNRIRIMNEFRAKYEINEQSKIEEIKKKWEMIDQSNKRRKMRNKPNSLQSIWNKVSGNKVSESSVEDNSSSMTQEEWEQFLDEEEKSTGFYLPGFFEVFPELKLKWPKWAKRRDGSAISCETDQDCQFPQACCPHPIIPGDKFCCTGFGLRIMVPAYQRREITSDSLGRETK